MIISNRKIKIVQTGITELKLRLFFEVHLY